MATETCDHKYVFIRQEEEQFGGYRPDVEVFDVFFCERCLEYKKKLVARIRADGCGSGYTRRSLL